MTTIFFLSEKLTCMSLKEMGMNNKQDKKFKNKNNLHNTWDKIYMCLLPCGLMLRPSCWNHRHIVIRKVWLSPFLSHWHQMSKYHCKRNEAILIYFKPYLYICSTWDELAGYVIESIIIWQLYLLICFPRSYGCNEWYRSCHGVICTVEIMWDNLLCQQDYKHIIYLTI